MHCSLVVLRGGRFSRKESVLPLLSSSLPPRCLRRAAVDEYRAQNKIGAPIHRYSRPGNEDMLAPANVVGRGSTFLFFFLSLSFTHAYAHTYPYTCTHMHTLSPPRFLPFSFSLFFSLSFLHFLLIALLISSSLSPRCTEHFNGTISPFAGNGASGDAIRRATR